jgi:hypothetical protein
MFAEVAEVELAAVLDRVAESALEEAGIAAPPVDALRVAMQLRLAVAWDDSQAGRARLVRLGVGESGGEATILVQHDPRPERVQWAVAHEIGESLAWQVFSQLDVDPRDAAETSREQVANFLAARILLPTLWFAADARALNGDLFALKQQYATASHELIARRLLDNDTPTIITVFDQGRVTWRRGNAGRVPPFSAQEVQCVRRVRERSAPQVSARDDVRVQGWPIYEPDWKREIVRTTWDGEAQRDAFA